MEADFELCKKVMSQFFETDSFSKYLGIKIVSFEKDRLKVEVPVKEELFNPYRTLHGGSLYAVCDIVAGTLACSGGYFCTTVDGSLNYLKPAGRGEKYYCEATLERRGAHLVVATVRITDENDDVTNIGTFTFFKTDKQLV